jgi:hypothetical protein
LLEHFSSSASKSAKRASASETFFIFFGLIADSLIDFISLLLS